MNNSTRSAPVGVERCTTSLRPIALLLALVGVLLSTTVLREAVAVETRFQHSLTKPTGTTHGPLPPIALAASFAAGRRREGDSASQAARQPDPMRHDVNCLSCAQARALVGSLDRAAIVAYLRTLSDNPAPLPGAAQ